MVEKMVSDGVLVEVVSAAVWTWLPHGLAVVPHMIDVVIVLVPLRLIVASPINLLAILVIALVDSHSVVLLLAHAVVSFAHELKVLDLVL